MYLVIVVIVLIRKKQEIPCTLNAVVFFLVSKSSDKLLQVVTCSVSSFLLLYWSFIFLKLENIRTVLK